MLGIRCSTTLLLRCLLVSLSVYLVACSSTTSPNRSPASSNADAAPPHRPRLDEVPDAVPRAEAQSRGGNKSPYTVLGKTYHVLASAEGYRERGLASWYGKKFHGRLTSNGEIYDAYAMTAAHRALPLPTYLRVRNLANQRSIIVRVNDRGPFHPDRLIDLSYAAAFKLGFHNLGTTEVEIEALTLAQQGVAAVAEQSHSATVPAIKAGHGTVLQAGAFRSLAGAEKLRVTLSFLLEETVFIDRSEADGAPWYRVRIGPIAKNETIARLRRLTSDASLGVLHIVDDTH